MPIEGKISLALILGTLTYVIWSNRFNIWCWWQGQKAARIMYPHPIDAGRRAWFARRYAANLMYTRYSIRAMRGIK